MGIQDRDYMKRPPDEDEGVGDGYPSDSKAEDLAQRFLKKNPRIFLYCGIGLAILIVLAWLAAKFSTTGH